MCNATVDGLFDFDLNIYPLTVYISLDVEQEKLDEIFEDGPQFDETDAAYVSLLHRRIDNANVVLMRFDDKKPSADLIAHESAHATFEILDYIKFNLDYENQEPFTYLLGYIVGVVHETVNNYNKEKTVNG